MFPVRGSNLRVPGEQKSSLSKDGGSSSSNLTEKFITGNTLGWGWIGKAKLLANYILSGRELESK